MIPDAKRQAGVEGAGPFMIDSRVLPLNGWLRFKTAWLFGLVDCVKFNKVFIQFDFLRDLTIISSFIKTHN